MNSVCLPTNITLSSAGHFLCPVFLFLPSVCSCSAITVLRSASVAIIHVITTLLPRQLCFPHESAAQCWQLSKIRSPLVNLNLVQRCRARTGAQLRGTGEGMEEEVETWCCYTHWVVGLDTPLPPAWHHRWRCLPRSLAPGFLQAPPTERQNNELSY